MILCGIKDRDTPKWKFWVDNNNGYFSIVSNARLFEFNRIWCIINKHGQDPYTLTERGHFNWHGRGPTTNLFPQSSCKHEIISLLKLWSFISNLVTVSCSEKLIVSGQSDLTLQHSEACGQKRVQMISDGVLEA